MDTEVCRQNGSGTSQVGCLKFFLPQLVINTLSTCAPVLSTLASIL